mgnify:CR=1 FL=1
MLGLGHDVVDVPAFAEQLGEPGSRMRNLFSMRELWQTAQRVQVKRDGEAVHLAARWAGKEAFLKAWCEAISRRANADGDIAYPYTLDDFPWARIEILDDSHGPVSCSRPRCDASCGNRWDCRLMGMINRAQSIFP